MTTYPPPSPPFITARYRGGKQTPKAIVIHGTVSPDNPGTARNIARWWNGTGSPKSSCHYVVDPKETIQCVGDHTVAFHCGYNTGSIGIELCDEQAGPASRWNDADSKAIIARAATLAAQLCLAYGIAVTRPSTADLKRRGPHGIYGHNDSRLAFGRTSHTDPRDFDWPSFMAKVRSEVARIKREALAAKPPRPKVRVRVGHASLQFSDTPAMWRHDTEAIFQRGYAWITGTEAGESDNWAILAAAAKKYGYAVRRYKSNWIAVKDTTFKPGTLKWGTQTVVDNDLVAGPGHDTGYIYCTFEHATTGVGEVSVVASHYPTKGKPEARDAARRINLRWTRKIGLAVSAVMGRLGKGAALAFYGGDQNISDKLSDTFFGGPVTSCWDELGKHPNTGHGPIDVIASHDGDARVRCVGARSYADTDLRLFTDHFLIEATYDIELA